MAHVKPLAIVRSTFDALVVGFFLLILLVGPLPMGANRDWAWAPITVAFGIVAALVALGLGSRDIPATAPRERLPLGVLIVCFLLMLGIGLLQMSPLAPAGPSAPFYARAAAVLGRAHAAVPTLSVDTSLGPLLRCLACGLVFAVARIFCADERRARLLLLTLVASAVLVMIYAVLELKVNSCFVGNYLKKQGEYMPGDRCTMSGTFVNSNSFGCFLGMAVAAAIGLVFAERKPRRNPEAVEEHGRLITAITGVRLALVATALFLTGGLLFSASRGGFAAFALSMVMFALLLMRGRWRSRRQMGGALIGGIVAVCVMIALAGGAFVQKMATFAQANNFERPIIWKAAVEAIEKSPWLGWGLGSFGDIYTILQPTQIAMANDKAHSTPLETFVELGIPGGVIACLVVVIPWITVAGGALRRRRHRYLPAAAFAASSVAIIHSLADFSLQMPAIGFFVSALLGMGWAQSFAVADHSPRPFTEPPE
jgi:O-antigen ligase